MSVCACVCMAAADDLPLWEVANFLPGEGISSEMIRSITKTPDGRIWMASWGGGVISFDGFNFKRFGVREGLPTVDVRAIVADSLGQVWAGTTRGIACFNGERWNLMNPGLPGIENPGIFESLLLPDGALWFTTSTGCIIEFRRSGEAVVSVGGCTPIPVGHWTTQLDASFTQGKGIWSLIIRQNGQIWAAVPRVGMAVFEAGVWKLQHSGKPYADVMSMCESDDGTLWTVDSESVFCVKENSWVDVTPPGKFVTCVAERVPGEMWLGTHTGIVAGTPTRWVDVPLSKDAPYPLVDNLFVEAHGNLWVGNHYGVSRITTPAWRSFLHVSGGAKLVGNALYAAPETPPLAPDSIGRLHQFDGATWQYVTDLAPGQLGLTVSNRLGDHLWFAFERDLVCYSISERRAIKNVPEPAGELVSGVAELPDGRLLVHTPHALYERSGEEWSHLASSPSKGSTFDALALGSADRYWITMDYTLNQWASRDGRLVKENTLEYDNLCRALFHDSAGNLYAGVDMDGIYSLETQPPNRLISFEGAMNKRLASLFLARDRTCWIGGREQTISSYQDGVWLNYGRSDGVRNGRVWRLGEYPAGVIWAGIQDGGIAQYLPHKDEPETIIPEYPAKLSNGNYGVFHFGGMARWENDNSESMMFSWRIRPANSLGGETAWPGFSKETTVVSPDLAPGDYFFEVRAMDHERNIDSSPAQARFQVLPPLWATSGFQVPMLCACLLLLLAARTAVKKHRALVLSEHSLREAKNQAEAASRAKSTFLSNVSHEIRTPLNAILGYTQLLDVSRDFTAEQKSYLQAIDRSGSHLLEVINGVLELSKIEAGRVVVHKENFDVHRMAQDAMLIVRAQCELKGLHCAVDIPTTVPQFIHADQGRIREILVNLLGNALKFTHEGEIRLRVCEKDAHEPQTIETDEIIFEVIDTGDGIPEGERETIFESFAQASTADPKQGTGLGLAISRQYARIMGGDLTVHAGAERGSLFRLRLPATVASVVSSAPELANAPQQHLKARKITGRAPVLLVVDDNEMNRDVLGRMLRQAGVEVRCAESGEEAVAAVAERSFDAVLMDMVMPGMGGCEATRQIKAMPGRASIPVLMVTANVLEEGSAAARSAGADGFVSKPFRFEDMLDELARSAGLEFSSGD